MCLSKYRKNYRKFFRMSWRHNNRHNHMSRWVWERKIRKTIISPSRYNKNNLLKIRDNYKTAERMKMEFLLNNSPKRTENTPDWWHAPYYYRFRNLPQSGKKGFALKYVKYSLKSLLKEIFICIVYDLNISNFLKLVQMFSCCDTFY